MTASQGWRLAEWAGRALLLGAVAFWWGLIVVPRLVSLALPDLLPPDAISRHLNPDVEGSLANAVSATALLIAALLAFANVVVSHIARAQAGPPSAAGPRWRRRWLILPGTRYPSSTLCARSPSAAKCSAFPTTNISGPWC